MISKTIVFFWVHYFQTHPYLIIYTHHVRWTRFKNLSFCSRGKSIFKHPCQVAGAQANRKQEEITHRIHGAGIFIYIGIIWKITLGVNVGKYSSTMDPLGIMMDKSLVIMIKDMEII